MTSAAPNEPDDSDDPDAPLARLRRWESSGGIWRVARRTGSELEIVLLTCTGGEEMGRLTSSDASLRAFIGSRTASDD